MTAPDANFGMAELQPSNVIDNAFLNRSNISGISEENINEN